ncbi:Rrf2 family transcriptional regulator [Carboxylicivirga caseinilyticus]|uniref:RrF2 family transcriptional regulator n=1 Tax=Carboxylicivirga caseinilyticus TaxID=3417572 RepID=UPI002AA88F63|nr:Rrf2 family transcriptional regulator [uncultured Carboxylicivirga sp.]MCU4166271.1 Rrf2 family transcriptional regulator [Marinilabiliaceae bacterium A049]
MFPKKVYYGLRFVLALAILPEGRLRGVAEIAENEDLPLKFLEAIAVILRKKGVVDVKRGAGGGYFLARPLKDITLYDLMSVLDEKMEKPIEKEGNNANIASAIFLQEVKDEYDEVLKTFTLDKLKAHYKEENDHIMYYI